METPPGFGEPTERWEYRQRPCCLYEYEVSDDVEVYSNDDADPEEVLREATELLDGEWIGFTRTVLKTDADVELDLPGFEVRRAGEQWVEFETIGDPNHAPVSVAGMRRDLNALVDRLLAFENEVGDRHLDRSWNR